jgi:hypothetical protein
MSPFDTHPAFRSDRPRSLQRLDLNAIRAVCPLEASEACAAVWRAWNDAGRVSAALAALKALPLATQSQIATDSIAYLAAADRQTHTQARRRAA